MGGLLRRIKRAEVALKTLLVKSRIDELEVDILPFDQFNGMELLTTTANQWHFLRRFNFASTQQKMPGLDDRSHPQWDGSRRRSCLYDHLFLLSF